MTNNYVLRPEFGFREITSYESLNCYMNKILKQNNIKNSIELKDYIEKNAKININNEYKKMKQYKKTITKHYFNGPLKTNTKIMKEQMERYTNKQSLVNKIYDDDLLLL